MIVQLLQEVSSIARRFYFLWVYDHPAIFLGPYGHSWQTHKPDSPNYWTDGEVVLLVE